MYLIQCFILLLCSLLALTDVPPAARSEWFADCQDYQYSPLTKKYYKAFLTHGDFEDALNRCKDEGAELLLPETDEEASMLTSSESIWIGLKFNLTNWEFVMPDGSSDEKFLRSAWFPRFDVDYADPSSECLAFRVNDLLNIRCKDQARIICTKTEYTQVKGSVRKKLSPWDIKKKIPSNVKMNFNNNKTYIFHENPLSYQEAVTACEREDSELLIPDSNDEADKIKEMTSSRLWIGYEYITLDGKFVFSNGTINEQNTNWTPDVVMDSGIPNAGCLVFDPPKITNARCEDAHKFVCSETKSVPLLNKCGGDVGMVHTIELNYNNEPKKSSQEVYTSRSLPSEFVYYNKTNKYFKIHSTPKTFEDAITTCKNEGSKLVIPGSRDEGIFLWNSLYETEMWVPLKINLAEGIYTSPNGYTRVRISNENFRHLTPDINYGYKEAVCIIMNDVAISNVRCDSHHRFICGKSDKQNKANDGTSSDDSWNDLRTTLKLFRSDYRYNWEFRSFYKVMHSPKTFSEAVTICEKEGAELAVPESNAESLLMFFEEKWVRLKFNTTTKTFLETDGELSRAYYDSIWHPTREINYENDNTECFKINGTTLVNIPCEEMLEFVCKVSLSSLKLDETDVLPGLGYKYNYITRKFYKLHKSPQTFKEADRTCSKEHGRLVLPESQKEFDVLKHIMATSEKIWIGLRFYYPKLIFANVNDGMKSSLLYSSDWLPDFDLQYNSEIQCLSTNGTKVSSVDCEYKIPFICSIEESSTIGAKTKFYREDYHYEFSFRSFYKLHKDPMVLEEAVLTCENEGAELALPQSRNELKHLFFVTNGSNFWIQLKYNATAESFLTLDGNLNDDFYDSSWETEWYMKPSKTKDDCISANLYNMRNVACDEKYPFVCKRTAFNPWRKANELVIPGDGYIYMNTTQKFYKPSESKMAFYEAVDECRKNGARLALPLTVEEMALLKDMLSLTADDKLWVDLKVNHKRRFYMTMDDERNHRFYKSSWNPKYNYTCCPEDFSQSECLQTDGASLQTAPCNKPLSFACSISESLTKRSATFYERQSIKDDFVNIGSTGKIFKLHDTPSNFEDALAICEKEGGSMTMPDTDEEAAMLVNLAESKIWIYVKYNNTESALVSQDGNLSPEFYVSDWHPSVDMKNDTNADCVILDEDNLKNVLCDERHVFFCSKRELRNHGKKLEN